MDQVEMGLVLGSWTASKTLWAVQKKYGDRGGRDDEGKRNGENKKNLFCL